MIKIPEKKQALIKSLIKEQNKPKRANSAKEKKESPQKDKKKAINIEAYKEVNNCLQVKISSKNNTIQNLIINHQNLGRY